MLDSFIGTFDQQGLRSLKSEVTPTRSFIERTPGQFWAILDSSVVPSINQAIALRSSKSDSCEALQIILQQARDIGSI
jgi:hypothetical protein